MIREPLNKQVPLHSTFTPTTERAPISSIYEVTTSPIMAELAPMFNTTDRTAPGYYGPSQTALLLLDFHTMFVERIGGPPAQAAQNVAVRMKAWAKSQGILVVHALNDINSTPFPTCKDAGMFESVMVAMRLSGGEEVAALRGDGDDEITFIRRTGYVSALRSPGLDDLLKAKGIKSLILTGLSTSSCVLRTAVAASDAEYVVSVISDACADNVEGVHDVVVEKLLNNRGYVATAAEFQAGFAKVGDQK